MYDEPSFNTLLEAAIRMRYGVSPATAHWLQRAIQAGDGDPARWAFGVTCCRLGPNAHTDYCAGLGGWPETFRAHGLWDAHTSGALPAPEPADVELDPVIRAHA